MFSILTFVVYRFIRDKELNLDNMIKYVVKTGRIFKSKEPVQQPITRVKGFEDSTKNCPFCKVAYIYNGSYYSCLGCQYVPLC